MKELKTGGPAFPIPLNPGEAYKFHDPADGMTLRDYFAAKAMQAWVSDDRFRFDKEQIEKAARFSYAMASVMIRERERNK